jgi:hypothetical protein
MGKPMEAPMMERKYTLTEIDAMRELVREKNRDSYPLISYCCPIGGSSYMAPESVTALHEWEHSCEDKLRTYMLGGLGPEDFPATEAEAA